MHDFAASKTPPETVFKYNGFQHHVFRHQAVVKSTRDFVLSRQP